MENPEWSRIYIRNELLSVKKGRKFFAGWKEEQELSVRNQIFFYERVSDGGRCVLCGLWCH